MLRAVFSAAESATQEADPLHNLPRLLYVGDLPIEGAMAGAAVLYRLLSNYPEGQLRIALSNLAVGSGYMGAPRLPGVIHDQFFLAHRRPLYTRLAGFYRWYVLARCPWARPRVRALAREFNAQAILTVTVGYSWRLAALLAREMHLPFYIVSHDDWRVNLDLARSVQPIAERWFAHAYRQAVARFVVSPYMASVYEQRYGVSATVLHPSRAKDAPGFADPPDRLRLKPPSNFVYAGSVFPRYAELLAQFARTLSNIGCTLTIYSPLSAEEIGRYGLDLANVTHRPVIPTDEMASRLRHEADVLLVPMSFHPDDRANTEVAFPSKLADYTATGLPILIWGPPYCTAVRWASQTGDVAAVVQARSNDALVEVVRRLRVDSEYRVRLGQGALAAGEKFFSYKAVAHTFFSAIR